MAREWRIELIKAHPDLFHPTAGHPEQAAGYPWCEQGWQNLLDRMCRRIESALRSGERVHFSQVKEKFAGLRVYWRGEVSTETATHINEAIALAQARAACTCEECGAAGELYNHAGRYQTLCDTHAKGAKIPARPGQENVHTVRVPSPERFRIAPRRYDRDGDRFVDVPPGKEE